MNDAFIRPGEARSAIPFRYDACGLDGIFLYNGFETLERDGDVFLRITDEEDLHCAIAHHLAVNRKVLAPKEIKFIRETLGFSQKALGGELGVNMQTVARWEKGHCEMPGSADRMLRILMLVSRLTAEQLLDWIKGLTAALESMGDGRDAPVVFEKQPDAAHWSEQMKEAA